MITKEKIKKLEDFFNSRVDIVMAFIFGSYAKGRTTTDSDIDLAIYFKTDAGTVEVEEREKEYPQKDEVYGSCVDILGTDKIDLVILNRAPANIAEEALSGIPLTVKDRHLWLEFMLVVTGRAEDFRSFVRDYDKIYWRSQSLTPQDAYSLARRLEFLNSELDLIKEYEGLSWREYQNNDIKRRVVERSIENVMNAVIDISKIILASQKRPAPQGYKQIIESASLFLKMPEEEVRHISSWASLRNILAHEYLDIRWKDIYAFLSNLNVVRTFLNAARNFTNN